MMDELMTKKYRFFRDNIEAKYCVMMPSNDGKTTYFCDYINKVCSKCEIKKQCDGLFGGVIPEIDSRYIKKMKNEIPELFI